MVSGATVTMDTAFWAATAIFLVAYALIVSERIHKTIVALSGASLILLLKIIEQREAFHVLDLGVDWNVVLLLVGMMIIVNLMRPTGVSKVSRGIRS